MRRVIRNVVTGGARLGAAFGVVVGSAGLVIGVGLSDRYGWSQVVAWVPREVFLAVLGISLGVVAGLGVRAARGRRRDGAARRRHGRAVRVVVLVLAGVCLVGAGMPWMRVGARPRTGHSVAWWNMSGYEITDLEALRGMDVVFVAHPGLRETADAIEGLGAFSGRGAGLVVSSAFPIDHLEWVMLGFEATHRNSAWNDQGRAWWVETGGLVYW
ncbi:MAG: hypothetical protein KDA28_03875, partial [Phycisphaerales bacterium]|nr:hypothetical protein [Phycisphaerales bacterium]